MSYATGLSTFGNFSSGFGAEPPPQTTGVCTGAYEIYDPVKDVCLCPKGSRHAYDAEGNIVPGSDCVRTTCDDFIIREDGTCEDAAGVHSAAEDLWFYKPSGKCRPGPPPGHRLRSECGTTKAGMSTGTKVAIVGGIVAVGLLVAYA